MAVILGIDLGTSSIKAMLLDEKQGVVAVRAQNHDVWIPRPGYAQQQPEKWWDSLCKVLQSLKNDYPGPYHEIATVGLSGQMHGLVLLGARKEVLMPAILWLDQRSAGESSEIMQKVRTKGWETLLQNQVCTGFAFPSLLWVKRNLPQVYQRIEKILQPKDYLRYCLTGEAAAEVTDASASLMFDVGRRQWAYPICEEFGIERRLLGHLGESMEIAGFVTDEAGRQTGLRTGIPVIYGAGDQMCQSIGNGVFEEGQAICNIGTGGQISVFSREDLYDPELRTNTFCFCDGGSYTVFGAMLCAGMALKWLKNSILQEESFLSMSAAAATIAPASEGLIFLPYLSGERTPHMNPQAKGMFFGLQLNHQSAHLIRAVMEGVTFGLKDSLTILQELGIAGERIIASGGAVNSPVWLQMQADIFQKEVCVCDVKEQACLGACILAGVGSGIFADLKEACGKLVQYDQRRYLPGDGEAYQTAYEQFRRLYQQNFMNLQPN